MSRSLSPQDSNAQSEFREKLHNLLHSHTSLPYLFLGSGLSLRYLGSPNWESLLRYFAAESGQKYEYLSASAEQHLPTVASSIAEKFHDVWWTSPFYEEQVAAFSKSVTGREGALKIAISELLRPLTAASPQSPVSKFENLQAELEALKQVQVDGVITTNYDNLTNEIFPTYRNFVGQEDLLVGNAQFIGEVYKIHGSIDTPESLVLTAQDYETYEQRSNYLVAKLLTIFAEHPVVFLGYSFNDEYIREIIGGVGFALGEKRAHDLKNRIYFIDWDENPDSSPQVTEHSLPGKNGSSITITRIVCHSFLPLFEELSSLERAFPPHLLRIFKEQVYEIVKKPDPREDLRKVKVINLEDDQNTRAIIGFGSYSDEAISELDSFSNFGMRGLKRPRVLKDVMGIDLLPATASQILEEGIPEALDYAPGSFIPVCKYFQADGRFLDNGEVNLGGLDNRVVDLLEKCSKIEANQSNKLRFHRNDEISSLTPFELMARDNIALSSRYELLLEFPASTSYLDELEQIIIHGLETNVKVTGLSKAICRYDYLTHHPVGIQSVVENSSKTPE